MSGALTANEEAQLKQTIEMFEVITQSQEDDYQSLEILKEAYSKLGLHQKAVNASKRIAQAYVQLGQLSSAILEYESILQRYPDDPDVRQALSEIESKANSFSAPAIETELLEKQAVQPAAKKTGGIAPPQAPLEIDDGKQAMFKIFVETKILSAADFNQYWFTPRLTETPRTVFEPFLNLLAEKQIYPIDKSLKLLCDRARLSYLPIERYDVDIELARSFAKETCYRWCVLPFDRMSKSVMVATVNPFNKQAAAELEAATRSRILWYLTSPLEISKVLKRIFR
jgi:tetratricopeptide (TPR) repeat protein